MISTSKFKRVSRTNATVTNMTLGVCHSVTEKTQLQTKHDRTRTLHRVANGSKRTKKGDLRQRALKLQLLPRYLMVAVEGQIAKMLPVPHTCNNVGTSFLDWDSWVRELLHPHLWTPEGMWMLLMKNVVVEFQKWKCACQRLGYRVTEYCVDVTSLQRDDQDSVDTDVDVVSHDHSNVAAIKYRALARHLLADSSVRESLLRILLAVILVRAAGREPRTGCVATMHKDEIARLSPLATRMMGKRRQNASNFKLSLGFLVDTAAALYMSRCDANLEVQANEFLYKQDLADFTAVCQGQMEQERVSATPCVEYGGADKEDILFYEENLRDLYRCFYSDRQDAEQNDGVNAMLLCLMNRKYLSVDDSMDESSNDSTSDNLKREVEMSLMPNEMLEIEQSKYPPDGTNANDSVEFATTDELETRVQRGVHCQSNVPPRRSYEELSHRDRFGDVSSAVISNDEATSNCALLNESYFFASLVPSPRPYRS